MKFKRLFIYFLIIILLVFCPTSYAADATIDNSIINEVESKQKDLKIYSNAVTLIDSKTGKTLYSKNANKRVYPASTTKILTSIIAIENIKDLQEKTIVKNSAISMIPPGYSSAYLSEGEEISLEYVLQVFLIHSANEAGNVLAEHVSGNINDFVNLMNKKVEELGCKNTHFVNTNGIHDENHYTTAADLATITRYCMKNQTFRNIVSMKSCKIPKTNKFEERFYKNTNDLINPSSKYYLPDCIGVKTGYTTPAKNCLISACNKNGLELIAVVLGAPSIESGASTRYLDSIELYKYGYSNFSLKKIATKGSIVENIEIKNATKDTKNLEIILANDITALVNTKSENVSYSISLYDNISAPIGMNSVLGSITYSSEGINYTADLIASHDVYKSNYFIFILGILIALILIIGLTIIRLKIKRFKKHIRRHY